MVMPRPKIILIVSVIIILIISILIWPKKQNDDENYLIFGDTKVTVELADSELERQRGLSGRQNLAPDNGLLFIFPNPNIYGFWMKEMHFAIDIIWLDNNWQVIGVSQNISPSTYPNSFYPPVPVKYVLEVNAGWAAQNNIATGTKALYSPGNEVPTIWIIGVKIPPSTLGNGTQKGISPTQQVEEPNVRPRTHEVGTNIPHLYKILNPGWKMTSAGKVGAAGLKINFRLKVQVQGIVAKIRPPKLEATNTEGLPTA